MTFISFEPKIVRHIQKREMILKASNPKKWPELSKKLSRVVRLNFSQGIKTFKKRVSAEALRAAWEKGTLHEVMTVLPWKHLPTDLNKTYANVGVGLYAAAESALSSLPPPISSKLRLDATNEKMTTYLDARKDRQIVQITNETRHFIQGQVNRSLTHALTPKDVANNIKSSIGLYPQQQTSLENYRRGLVEDGLPPAKVDALAAIREDELLDYRCMMIGRTETMMALNTGEQMVWTEAADQGLIDRNVATREWLCDTDPCNICEPMDGVNVGIDEPWILEDGTEVDIPTQTHPHCLCMQILNIDGEDKF